MVNLLRASWLKSMGLYEAWKIVNIAEIRREPSYLFNVTWGVHADSNVVPIEHVSVEVEEFD